MVDAGEVIFDRIFGGDDLAIGPVELIQRGVERCGLARPGRTRHQKDSVGPFDDLLKRLVVFFLEPQIHDADAHGIGTQDTQHDRFTVICRQRAGAEVDLLLVDHQLDAAVLRKPLLRDVDAGHDFQPADQRAFHAQGNAVALDAFAVDSISHANAVLHRLDVNIRCAVADGLGDHRLHQLDDGRLRGVGRPVPFADAGDVDRLVDGAVDRFIDGAIDGLVERAIHRLVKCLVPGLVDRVGSRRSQNLIEQRLDFRARRQRRADFLVEPEAENIEHLQIQRIVNDDPQPAVLHAQRQDEVLAHQIVWNQIDRVGGDRGLVQLDIIQPVLGGQRLEDISLGADLQIDQRFANAHALLFAVLQRLGDVLGIGKTPFNQQLTEFFLLTGHNSGRQRADSGSRSGREQSFRSQIVQGPDFNPHCAAAANHSVPACRPPRQAHSAKPAAQFRICPLRSIIAPSRGIGVSPKRYAERKKPFDIMSSHTTISPSWAGRAGRPCHVHATFMLRRAVQNR